VAAIDLAGVYWQHGDGRGAAEWAAQSRALVDGAPPSAGHAHVLAQVARLEMLAGQSEQSLITAERAIVLADASGAAAPRVSALITKATARANVGEAVDEDFEEALHLSLRHNLSEVGRVYINRSSTLVERGELERAMAVAREGVVHLERLGTLGGSGGFVYGNLCEACFLAGDWDEADEIARAELERAARAGGLYYEPLYVFARAEMAAARGGAVDIAAVGREVVALGHARGDPQMVVPCLATGAWMVSRAGEELEAEALLDELLERWRANPSGARAGWWTVHAALALALIRRSGALAVIGSDGGSRFVRAALEIDGGGLITGAETLRAVGASPLEAETRVVAARALRDDGDDAGADAQLAEARVLLERLGATTRLRELDAV
jgi:hypothetical protein